MIRLMLALVLGAFPIALSACSEAPAAERSAGSGSAAVEVEAPAGDLRTIALRIPDMSCGLCAKPIERNLQAMGVRDVQTDLKTKWVTGRYDPERLTPETIRAKVEELKFRVAEVRVS